MSTSWGPSGTGGLVLLIIIPWILPGSASGQRGPDTGTTCAITVVNASSATVGVAGTGQPLVPADSLTIGYQCGRSREVVVFGRVQWDGAVPPVSYFRIAAGEDRRLGLQEADFAPWPGEVEFPRSRGCADGHAGVDISGMVIPDPAFASVHGATIQLVGAAGRTAVDSIGRFTLACVPPDAHSLLVEGSTFPSETVTILRRGEPLAVRVVPISPPPRCVSTEGSRQSSAVLMGLAGVALGGLIAVAITNDLGNVYTGAAIGGVAGAFIGYHANRLYPPCR